MAAFGRSSVKRAETAQSIADAKAASRFSGDYFVYPQDLSADYCFSIKMQSYKFAVKKEKQTEVGTHYFLPIPSSITDNFGINYTTPELGAIGGAIAAAGMAVGQNLAAAGSAREMGTAFTKSVAGLASSAMDAAKQADGGSVLAAVNAAVGGEGKVGGTLSAFLGEVPNPNVTAFFKGVELKNHSFTWELYPQSQEESKTLHNMINKMRMDSLPERVTKTVSTSTDKDAKKAKISPFLKYPMEAHVSITTRGAQNTIIFKPAFITTLSVNYAPNGPAFLENGQPAGVTLTLGFKEQDIWTKGDYGSTGANESSGAAREMGLTAQNGIST